MINGLLFNVGPLSNDYFGVHTYSDVLFPLVQKMYYQNIRFTWAGIDLVSHLTNDYLVKEGIEQKSTDSLEISSYMRHRTDKSWDLMDISEFQFLLCQPRPLTNRAENAILHTLIDRFLDAGKPVFVWEQDMFTGNFTERMKEQVVLLHPAVLPPEGFKNTHFLPFAMYDRQLQADVERKDDFIFIGNVYSRRDQAVRFFGKLNDAPFSKTVYGDWKKDTERAAFASQFTNFDFRGSTEHWAAIPLMQRAKATLHIVPEFAEPRGLMTARTFTSQMARCICFCDKKIYGAEMFYPDSLIVEDGDDLKDRWDWVMTHREAILDVRQDIMKRFTVENSVKKLKELLSLYGIKDTA